MSYLDFPRIHFSGLFYTAPSTINNIIKNYKPTVDLELPSPPNPPNQFAPRALWNPLGVAQWWLEECTVLSGVGPTGAEVNDPSADPVINASVWTPSPKTPMDDGAGGFYDIAKMVDLDPDQQGRSAVYGLRLAVTLPNGAGLQGSMTIPELRQLNARIASNIGMWNFVGNWMGTLQNVEWSGDISGSPLLTALQAAGAQGLNVKFTSDLFQPIAAKLFTVGDRFCYGRVLGSIGPALAGELSQMVPGRCLQTYKPPADSDLESAADANPAAEGTPVISARDRVAAKARAISERRMARGLEAADVADTTPPDPWNPAFALVQQAGAQTFLSIDIGGSILLNGDPPGNATTSDGTFEVDSGIAVGFYNASNNFVPFENGDINISPQYQPLDSDLKKTTLVKNSGVFTIPLTAGDGTLYQTRPLAIQVNGETVALESANGLWADVSVSGQRLECGGQPIQAQLMVRVFGNALPANTAPPLIVQVALVNWATGSAKLTPSNDLTVTVGKTGPHGVAAITTAVNIPNISPAPTRQPLDSQVYYVFLIDPTTQQPIGDGSATLSTLLWNAYQIPANPTWANDVGPIFTAYARLYPGMKSRLDISDEETVKNFAGLMLSNHIDLPITDPAYMPVTRDLSPSKMAMIKAWLKQVS